MSSPSPLNPTTLLIAAGIFLLLLAVWGITLYNTLVRLRAQCREAWSNVDTELKRRYDLIPNLVATVKGYTQHEHETLQRVIQARNTAVNSTGAPAQQAQDENLLIASLKQLFAVVENYPVLKADQHYLALQQQLIETEDRIQAARRFYNGNVRDLNTRVAVFPSNLVAGVGDFQPEDYFEIEDTGIRTAPAVKL